MTAAFSGNTANVILWAAGGCVLLIVCFLFWKYLRRLFKIVLRGLLGLPGFVSLFLLKWLL